MEFAKAARKQSNYTYTENAAVALKSTESALLDLFATVGAMRGKNADEISRAFEAAFNEDRLLATKLMFYARNIRGGLGERNTFRKMLYTLAVNQPEIVIKNIDLIPHFGRYDDLYALVGTKAEGAMWKFISETIQRDVTNMIDGNPVSLCAKWLKSVNTSSKESNRLGRLTAKNLGLEEMIYRRTLSGLRKYIKIVERYMSSGNWEGITYSQVPSRAMKNYRKAFAKHDEIRFLNFIGNVAEGKEEIKASTLYPYDILEAGNLHYNYRYGSGNRHYFEIDNDAVLEAQWKALPNYVEGEHNILVMADTSGSMYGRPMATSIGLAIYFAERNRGAYKDLFLTFSARPEFINLKGETLAEKLSCVESIVANTNLEAAFDLILSVAVKNKISEDEMPKSLIIISDMHFDLATTDYRRGEFDKQTFHVSMMQKYEEAGYRMPTIIYWNVAQRESAFQVDAEDTNVILVSGQSTSTFKNVLGSVTRTPYEFMLETLNDPQYEMVKI